MAFRKKKKKVRFRLDITNKLFAVRDSEALEQIAWRSFVCPISESVQGQVKWGFEQLLEGALANGRELVIKWSLMFLPTQTIQSVYDST